MIALNLEQINIMKHAWGWSGKKPGFRSHYSTQMNCPKMKSLVEAGMFKLTYDSGFGEGCGMFHLTDEGIKYLKALKT